MSCVQKSFLDSSNKTVLCSGPLHSLKVTHYHVHILSIIVCVVSLWMQRCMCKCMLNCRIAGNFCGRKLSWIAIKPWYSRRFSPSTVHTVRYHVMCVCAGDLCTLRLCKFCPNPLLLPMKHNLYMYKKFSCCCCRSPKLWETTFTEGWLYWS